MWFSSWLRHRTVSRKHRPARRFRPRLEALEDRAVPATLTVNTTLDILGHTNGMLSLRQAIIDANAKAQADTIVLPAGTYALRIPGAGEYGCLTGDLNILGPLTINGAGAGSTVIDAAGLDRAFEVGSCTVTLAGMTIKGGSASSYVAGTSPFLGEGGAIFNSGTLKVTNCVISGNYAILSGGGIFNGGTLTVSNSVLSGNSAGKYGGGIYNYFSGSTVKVFNSTLSGNHATTEGGAIWNDYYAAVTLQGSTLSGNSAFNGAGIFNQSGTLTVSSCTFSNNSAGFTGGAIYNTGTPPPWTAWGTVTILNSTLSGNSAVRAGGIYNASYGKLTINGSTVDGNVASGRFASVGADLYNLGFVSIDSASTVGVIYP
jgi:predicted outer membrane repeat protein